MMGEYEIIVAKISNQVDPPLPWKHSIENEKYYLLMQSVEKETHTKPKETQKFFIRLLTIV